MAQDHFIQIIKVVLKALWYLLLIFLLVLFWAPPQTFTYMGI